MFRLFYLFFFWGVVILNLAKSIQWHRTFRHTYNSHLRKHRVILLYESGDVFRSPELCILFGCDQPNLQCDLTSDLGAVHHDKVGGAELDVSLLIQAGNDSLVYSLDGHTLLPCTNAVLGIWTLRNGTGCALTAQSWAAGSFSSQGPGSSPHVDSTCWSWTEH